MGFRCLLVIGCLCIAFMANAAPTPAVPQAQLNAQQREWLAAHPELRVGVVLQAPYAQYDRRLQRLSGANVELMQWLAKALNIDLVWRNFPSQEQLEAAVRDDEVDIAPEPATDPGRVAPVVVHRPLYACAPTHRRHPGGRWRR